MKFLKIINFVAVLFRSVSAEANTSTVTIQSRINAIKSIQQNTFWANEIECRPMSTDTKWTAVNNCTRTLRNAPEADRTTASDVSNRKDNDDDDVQRFLYNNSKTMYAALKCKYSEAITNAYRFYADYLTACDQLTSCKTDTSGGPRTSPAARPSACCSVTKVKCAAAVTRLVTGHKVYVSKMIFELMYFAKVSPSLRSTDDTLLKTLMSVNLFLHRATERQDADENDGRERSKNACAEDDVNAGTMKTATIGRIINMVERYSHVHCDAQQAEWHEWSRDDIYRCIVSSAGDCGGTLCGLPDGITDGFKTLFGNVRVETVDGLNVPTFSAMHAMYDPRRLLLVDVFGMDGGKYASLFSSLKVRWRDGFNNGSDGFSGTECWKALRTVCEEAERSADLATVFGYQVLLVEVVKDMFYVKLINAHAADDRATVLELIGSFERFVDDVLPANYPTGVYVPIARLRNCLCRDRDRAGPTGDTAILSDATLALLVDSPVINTWGASNDTDRLLAAVVMSQFVRSVTELETFGHFVRVFELLSYQSYALGDYRLAHAENADRGPTCRRAERLRECLVAFRLLMDAFHRVFGQHSVVRGRIRESADRAVAAVRRAAVSFYVAHRHDDPMSRILWPLVVRGLPAGTIGAHADAAMFRSLGRTAASASNALERYELDGCRPPHRYNRDMWRDMWRDVSGDDGRLCSGPWSPRSLTGTGNAAVHLPFVFRCRGPLTREIVARAAAVAATATVDDHWSRFLQSAAAVEHVVPAPVRRTDDDNNGRGECSSRTRYAVWDGSRVFVEDAYDEMRCSAMPLDHARLVRFQLFEIKWIVSRVFEKSLQFVLTLQLHRRRGVDPPLDRRSSTAAFQRDVKRFQDLPLPESISAYVRSALDQFPEALASRDARTVDAFLRQIVERINTLSMSAEDPITASSYRESSERCSLSGLRDSLHADVENLKFILQYTDKHGTNLIENLPFSSIL